MTEWEPTKFRVMHMRNCLRTPTPPCIRGGNPWPDFACREGRTPTQVKVRMASTVWRTPPPPQL